jgi:hypothetical protein
MSVGKKYEVMVSDRVRIDSNMPGHILNLSDRPLFKPDTEGLWPVQENLARQLEQMLLLALQVARQYLHKFNLFLNQCASLTRTTNFPKF